MFLGEAGTLHLCNIMHPKYLNEVEEARLPTRGLITMNSGDKIKPPRTKAILKQKISSPSFSNSDRKPVISGQLRKTHVQ
jgi:hypothetical protein